LPREQPDEELAQRIFSVLVSAAFGTAAQRGPQRFSYFTLGNVRNAE
jgi:hypothetical protein